MSKRNYEKRIREEEEAAAHVFQDFLTSFQGVPSTPAKVFIKCGVINTDKSTNVTDLPKSQIYVPKPLIPSKNVSMKTAIECAKILKEADLSKNKNKEKPRSNLEILKEEIKQRQLKKEESCVPSSIYEVEGNDPFSTNLFIANLNPKMTEEQLMLLFGKFGALASVKIMWPRGEEKFRNYSNTNCGFVAFMSRKDAEKALLSLEYRDDMRLSWGKSVEIPSHPIYVPPRLTKSLLPPPFSGLPFNAQPTNFSVGMPNNYDELDLLLSTSVVKVTIPLDKKMLCLIHRMIEFVVHEGPLFEALIMMTEVNNPDFAFLFDYRSHLHSYYRWKLFSILNGDGQKMWRQKPFRMVKNGPIWIPPKPIDYTSGMPNDLVEDDEKTKNDLLSEAQCARLMDLIKNLNMSRDRIRTAMSFCINHIDALSDTLSVIFDSLKHSSTTPVKKIARLYLLSDIFCNCRKFRNIKFSEYESNVDFEEIFQSFRSTYVALGKVDKEHFKTKVLSVLTSWNNYRIFSVMFLEKLEGFFLELNDDEDFICDEPLDGASLLKRTSVNNKDVKIVQPNTDTNYFINSSWNRVDPKDLESQAMSTQKLYEMELSQKDGLFKEKNKHTKHKKESTLMVASKWDSDDDL